MTQANLERLLVFAQHGQPPGYGGSDMMRDDLEAVLRAQADKIAKLEREAARYRWLRDDAQYSWHVLKVPFGQRDLLDAAIDAEIEKAKGART